LLARRVSLQKSVGDVWSRISSANALQKERSGSSERRPSSSLSLADETVLAGLKRNDESQVGLDRQERARTGIRPRVARDRHPAVSPSRKRCGGRGTGAVKATGSYEGSLPAEGIPDQHEASTFTSRRRRWSRCSAPPFDPYEPFQRRTHGEEAASTKVDEARGERAGHDRGVRGSVAIDAVGRKRPRSSSRPKSQEHGNRVDWMARRSGLGRRETSGPPKCCAEPYSPRGLPVAKAT
jgi:hypothetical protein